jgi:hypothetical protein
MAWTGDGIFLADSVHLRMYFLRYDVTCVGQHKRAAQFGNR